MIWRSSRAQREQSSSQIKICYAKFYAWTVGIILAIPAAVTMHFRPLCIIPWLSPHCTQSHAGAQTLDSLKVDRRANARYSVSIFK